MIGIAVDTIPDTATYKHLGPDGLVNQTCFPEVAFCQHMHVLIEQSIDDSLGPSSSSSSPWASRLVDQIGCPKGPPFLVFLLLLVDQTKEFFCRVFSVLLEGGIVYSKAHCLF